MNKCYKKPSEGFCINNCDGMKALIAENFYNRFEEIGSPMVCKYRGSRQAYFKEEVIVTGISECGYANRGFVNTKWCPCNLVPIKKSSNIDSSNTNQTESSSNNQDQVSQTNNIDKIS